MANKNKMSSAKKVKLAAAIVETVAGIPVLGAMLVISTFWVWLLVGLALNIIALVLSNKNGEKRTAPILGIIANALGWVPMVAMIMHIIAAVFLYIEALKK